jgi:hypothetical protein
MISVEKEKSVLLVPSVKLVKLNKNTSVLLAIIGLPVSQWYS